MEYLPEKSTEYGMFHMKNREKRISPEKLTRNENIYFRKAEECGIFLVEIFRFYSKLKPRPPDPREMPGR